MDESSKNKRFLEGYELYHTLGKGMSGKVKLAKAPDGTKVAIKLIFVDKMTSRSKEHLQREIKAMMDLQHPNIMQLRRVLPNVIYTKKNGTTREVVALVLELAGSGELFEFIMHTGKFPEALARTFYSQLVDAMSLCQRQGISHRDLKPENVLLDDQFQLKIADFGLASLAEESPTGMCKTKCGTTSYMAPEVLAANRLYDGNKADVWSSGVILFIMIAGNPPFEQASSTDWWFTACRCGRYDRFWAAHLRTCPEFPALAQDLLNKIFVDDPTKRLSFEQIKLHPWMKSDDIYSSSKLKAELSQRLERIKTVKIANKRKEEMKKKNTMVNEASPFERPVHRAVSSDSPSNMLESTLTQSDLPLHAMLGALYSHVPLDKLIEAIVEAVKKCDKVSGSDKSLDVAVNDAPIIKSDQTKVKAIFAKRDLEIKIKVYSGIDDGLLLIHISRIQGDAWQFHSIQKTLVENLSKLGVLYSNISEETERKIDSDDLLDEIVGNELANGLSAFNMTETVTSEKVDLI
jgi:serine/threonine protein kinase